MFYMSRGVCVVSSMTVLQMYIVITYIKLLTVSIDGSDCHVLHYMLTHFLFNFIFCSGIFEINCSKDLKIQGIIGPCASLEKVCLECLTSFLLLTSTTEAYLPIYICRKAHYAQMLLLVKGVQVHGRCVDSTNPHHCAYFLML